MKPKHSKASAQMVVKYIRRAMCVEAKCVRDPWGWNHHGHPIYGGGYCRYRQFPEVSAGSGLAWSYDTSLTIRC